MKVISKKILTKGRKKLMKKQTILYSIIAFSALVACTREIEVNDQVKDEVVPESYSFSAVFAPDTKTALGEGNTVLWKSGDAISVFDGEGEAGWASGYTKDAKYVTSSEGATAYFNPAGGESDREVTEGKSVYYALAPRVSDASCDVSTGVVSAWLSNRQKGNAGTFPEARGFAGRTMAFAIAKTNDPQTEPFTFYNMLSLLKVVVPEELDGKVYRIGVHAKGEYIGGDVVMCLNNGEPWTKLRKNIEGGSGSTYSDIYLLPDHKANNIDPSTATFAAGTYYIAVLPCALKDGFTVDYQTDADKLIGAIACQKTYGPITFQRSKIYNLGSINAPGQPVAAEGEGIDGLPYVFSFFDSEQTNNTPKYVTKGTLSETTYSYENGNSYRQYSGVAATDKDETGVTMELSACTYYKVGTAAAKTNTPQFENWAQVNGHDNFNVRCCTSNFSVAGQPFDSGWYLNIPLKADLPKKFNVSFGDCIGNAWGVISISLMYSYDKKQWTAADNFRIAKETTSGTRYYYYTAEVDAPKVFKAGTMLYLKLITIGNCTVKDTDPTAGSDYNKGHDGFGAGTSNSGQHRFHSCIAITPAEIDPTEAPADAVYFQAFNDCNGGLDYMIGEKLAGMANHCGAVAVVAGMEGSNIYQRPGYLQLGYVDSQTMSNQNNMTTTNLSGSVTTPALGKAGDLSLSFKACAYRNPVCGRPNTIADANADVKTPDVTSIVVTVVGEGTIDGEKSVQIDDLSYSAWQTITKTVAGANADTKIQFSSPSTGLFHRWFLDEICVK